MPESANSVASGLSPLPKSAKPGKADLRTGAETSDTKVTAFSNNLDQARQQQLDKARAEPSQRGGSKEGQQASAAGLKHAASSSGRGQVNRSGEGRVSQDTLTAEPTALNVAGSLMPIEVDDSANGLLPATSPPHVVEANPNVAAAMDIQSDLPSEMPLTATLSGKNNEDPVVNPDAVQLPRQQSAESTPVVRDATPALKTSTSSAGAVNGAVAGFVTQATLAGRSRQVFNTTEPTGTAESAVADSPDAPALLTLAEGLDAKTGRLSKELPSDFVLRKTPTEHSAALTTPAALSKSGFQVSGEAARTVLATPAALNSDQANKAALPLVGTVELTQIASGNGIVTQAAFAGRFGLLNNDAAPKGTETTLITSDSGLMQAEARTLDARGAERQPVGNLPMSLVHDSKSGSESLMAFIDGNTTVQQRIATTEAMLSQMAQEAGDVVVRTPVTNNMLLAMPGGTAPMAQQGDAVAAPIMQAPLNIPLTSADAETALAGNVKWMTNEGVKNAVMTVTPHGMGPISVKIGIEGNQMDVSIIASQHTTRDALEAMLPRLREQLAVQGHDSVKVDVSDGKSEQSRSGNGQTFAESRNQAGTASQDNQSNSRNHDDKTEYGRPGRSEVDSGSFMAEDLQRVAARVVGEVDGRSGFDAYV